MRFQLVDGGAGPLQQSSVSCGSACLVVARMLADGAFARRITQGGADQHGSAEERFAAAEREVMARTNRPVPGRASVGPPWPTHLGTPPWGALGELEDLAPGTAYSTTVVRHLRPAALAAACDDLRSRIGEQTPALLYVGNASLPRHVVLLFRRTPAAPVLIYEPASGRVLTLDRGRFAGSRLGLGGWSRVWCAVAPSTSAARQGAPARSPWTRLLRLDPRTAYRAG